MSWKPWTKNRADKAALSGESEIIEFRTGRNTAETLAMLDEKVFRLRPEFPLQLSFEDAEGNKTKIYSPEHIIALSRMRHVRRLTLGLHLKQPFSLNGGPRQLEELRIWPGKAPCDIDFIGEVPNLKKLYLANRIADFTPIRSLAHLETLGISATIPSLAFLENLTIPVLLLDHCDVKKGWEYLASTNIRDLYLGSNKKLEDISFLGSCASLRKLAISQSKVRVLCDCARLDALEEVILKNMSKLESLRPLARARALRRIELEALGAKIQAEDFRVLLTLPHLAELSIPFLDFSEKQCKAKAIHRLFQEAGKGNLVAYQ